MKKLSILITCLVAMFLTSCTKDEYQEDGIPIRNDEYTLGIWEEFTYKFNYNGTVYTHENISGNWKNILAILDGEFLVQNYTQDNYVFFYTSKRNGYGTYDFFNKENIKEDPIVFVREYKDESNKLLTMQYSFSEMSERMKKILVFDKEIPEDATGIIITYIRKFDQSVN